MLTEIVVLVGLLVRPAAGAQTRAPDVLVYDGPQSRWGLIAANLDGDGAEELAWTDHSDHLWIATDPSSLTEDPGTVLGGFGRVLAAPDYDGDGVDNLVVAVGSDPRTYDYTRGDLLDVETAAFATADVDGDGYDDLIDPDGVLRGGPTGFTRGAALDGVGIDNFYRAFAVGDLDGDGATDVAVCASTTEGVVLDVHSAAELRLYLTSDRGAEVWPARWSWAKPPFSEAIGPYGYGYAGYVTGYELTPADIDGDGALELVVLSSVLEDMLIETEVSLLDDLLDAAGPRVLASQLHEASAFRPSLHRLGDLDGDGDDEVLFTTEWGEEWLRVIDAEPFEGQVLAQLDPVLELPLPESDATGWDYRADDACSAVGDFDDDGVLDVAAAYNVSGSDTTSRVAIWYGTSLRIPSPADPGPAESEDRPDDPSAPGCGCAAAGGGPARLALVPVVVWALGRRRGRRAVLARP